MEPMRSALERRFERWLWRFRLIAILPVVMSLLSTAASFLCGTQEILHSLGLLMHSAPDDSRAVAELLGELVGGVDLYLIGIALLIFGYVKGRFTGVNPLKSALQTGLVGGLAALAAYSLAKLFG